MRERWFGATRQRVPEIVVEGDPVVALDQALILDDVSDDERLRTAHEQGTPVVVRADNEQDVKAALERPEVACVVVPEEHRDLLDLDLRNLTYG
ncbi:MAG: hypothetical protein M3R70_12460 [Actinomycetota bacterium]|nr:hypothetical protein [Actinomycetota bacterium]